MGAGMSDHVDREANGRLVLTAAPRRVLMADRVGVNVTTRGPSSSDKCR